MRDKSKPSPASKPLLFINQREAIPTREQVATLRSYVHGAHRRWAKKSRLKATHKPSPRGSSKTDEDAVASSLASSIHIDTGNSQPIYRLDLLGATSAHVSSPIFWKGNSDPFAAAVVPITPEKHSMIQRAQQFQVFTLYLLGASASFREQWDGDMRRSTKEAVSERASMHTILAAGCYVLARSGNQEQMLRLALEHKTESIKSVRLALQNNPSANVTYPVFNLIALDFVSGNYTAARQHMHALRQILTSRYLDKSRDVLFARSLMTLNISDVWIAYSSCLRTQVPISEWDRGRDAHPPIEHGPRPGDYQKRLARSILEPVLKDDFYPDLIDGLSRASLLKKMASSMPDLNEQERLVIWLHLRFAALSGWVLNRLMDALDDNLTNPSLALMRPQQLLSAALSLAIMGHLHLEFARFPYPGNQAKMFALFEPVLKNLHEHHAEWTASLDPRLLLWLFFMSTLNNELLPPAFGHTQQQDHGGNWSLEMLHQAIEHLGISIDDWEGIRSFLQDFPYHTGSEIIIPDNTQSKQSTQPQVWRDHAAESVYLRCDALPLSLKTL